MAYRTSPHNTLVIGQWLGICDVCGFRFHSGDLRKRWDGMYVCKDDYEERHPSDFLRGIEDNPSVPWTRPDSNSDTNTTDISGNAIVTDNTPDTVGDADKTLTVGSSHNIQTWNTTLTADRTVTLSTVGAMNGDRWTIYRTAGGDYNLIIGSVQTTGIKSMTVVEYRDGAWRLVSYTPLGL